VRLKVKLWWNWESNI